MASVTSQVGEPIRDDVPVRMMLVGDSMTIGSAGEHTWRHRMWQHLGRAPGGPYQFVGPRTGLHDPLAGAPVSHDYADPAFPEDARRHLAGWGEGWLHMAPLIRDAVATHRADVLLVSLGLIDLGFYTDAERTAANVRRFVTEARSADPRIRIVALPVIPNVRARTDAPFDATCERFNTLLATAFADLATPASPLVLASPPADWVMEQDTYDGTHPSASGEHKLAAAFADAMHRAWQLGAPYRIGSLVVAEPA
ncbi:GDSL-type esterase/lipase family protein [Streptomyces sp. NPDC048639]|uniref:GDSL-type esterase/lipase family protein n=1 Tax=Streptomyces sp. NPDC048639 TaxID=3365581 RepID=UPI003723E6B2